ncbi:unnamed protein product [Soboliphyme baturini]|uniref:ACAD9/ACADV-like C-terminal domain-containing protein n=1 Tax=Soboliphyme baturini TaxID=241478 RepID=A0A183IAB3_9BILA|nr:unnamed protein product [Soboliphyme baturini]
MLIDEFGCNETCIVTHKFKHYIYEKVHPSLEDACRFIEEVMSKFEYTIRQQLQAKGKEIEADAFAQLRLCDIATSLFIMLTSVSRASRSYSIGLKDGDLEVGSLSPASIQFYVHYISSFIPLSL